MERRSGLWPTRSSMSSHVGESEVHGVRDIYDTQGIGFVYSFLIPVYKHAKAIICRLTKQLGQVVPDLPDL